VLHRDEDDRHAGFASSRQELADPPRRSLDGAHVGAELAEQAVVVAEVVLHVDDEQGGRCRGDDVLQVRIACRHF
jgi:hypothetical protein